MNRTLLTVALITTILPLGAREASPAPASPNYCARLLCVQVDQLGSEEVTVRAESNRRATEVIVESRLGSARVSLVLASPAACTPSSEIVLRQKNGNYVGTGCVTGAPGAGLAHVEVTFCPTESARKESLKLPISAIWQVDDAPVTFWEHGYALRLGAAVKVELEE